MPQAKDLTFSQPYGLISGLEAERRLQPEGGKERKGNVLLLLAETKKEKVKEN